MDSTLVDELFSEFFEVDDTFTSVTTSPEAVEADSALMEPFSSVPSQPSSASSTSLTLFPLAGDSAFSSPLLFEQTLPGDDKLNSFDSPHGALSLSGVDHNMDLKQSLLQSLLAMPLVPGTIDPNTLQQQEVPVVNAFSTFNWTPTSMPDVLSQHVSPVIEQKPLVPVTNKRKHSGSDFDEPEKKRPGRPRKDRSISSTPSSSATPVTPPVSSGNKTEQAKKLIPDKYLERAKAITGFERADLLKYKFASDLLAEIDSSKHADMNKLFSDIQTARTSAKEAATRQRQKAHEALDKKDEVIAEKERSLQLLEMEMETLRKENEELKMYKQWYTSLQNAARL